MLGSIKRTKNLIQNKQDFFDAVRFFKEYDKGFKDAAFWSDELIRFNKSTSAEDKKYLMSQKDTLPQYWINILRNGGFVKWGNPDVLYQISKFASDGGFDHKKAAAEIVKHSSITDVIMNWLEGDFSENKQIGKSIALWETLKEVGLLSGSGYVDKGCACIPVYVSKSLDDAIPEVVEKFVKAHSSAPDASETLKRFEESRGNHFHYLAD